MRYLLLLLMALPSFAQSVHPPIYATPWAASFLRDAGPFWQDVRIPVSTLRNPASTPHYVVWTNGLYAFAMDKDTDESLYAELQIPHGIDTNNAYGLRLHIHWTGNTAGGWGTSNVVWGIEYTMAAPNGTFPETVSLLATNGLVAAGKHMIATWPTITNIAESGVLSLRLFRDANSAGDTYATDAFPISLDAHLPMIKLGSVAEFGDY